MPYDISTSAAQDIVNNFRAVYPNLNEGLTIPKSEVIELLNQSGAVGLRMYLAMHDQDDDEINLVLCAVDSNGDDITTYKNNCLICPPNCGNGL